MFLYAYDMCLMGSSEKNMRVIMEQVDECAIKYDLSVLGDVHTWWKMGYYYNYR